MASEEVFSVSKGYLAYFRIRAAVFVAVCLYLIWLVAPPGATPLSLLSMPLLFWAALPLVIGIPAVFAWLAWRNVPWGADKGRLQISPDGVQYSVGPDRIHRGWAQVSAIHPVRRPGWTTPTAIWLPVDQGTPPERLGERDLWLAMFKAAYRPVQRPDGLLLPIGIFGQGAAKAITESLRRHLEAAHQQERNP